MQYTIDEIEGFYLFIPENGRDKLFLELNHICPCIFSKKIAEKIIHKTNAILKK